MNKAILMGRLGNDPEIKTFDNGTKVVNFSLATSKRYKNKQGEKIDETQWHRVSVFGSRADVIEKCFKKGNKILVEGEIVYRAVGEKYFTDIIMSHFEFVESKVNEGSPPF